jgi:UDP-glucose 4-epimerase
MKILVTGGAGFIASHIVDRYLADGHEVCILDNLSTGRRENVPPQARLYEADIRDAAQVQAIMAREKPEVVNHHAAQISVVVSLSQPRFDAETNILGSLNLIQAALDHGVQKFIYGSTGGAVYGDVPAEALPIPETYPVHPISPYGISKHTVEHYLYLAQHNYGLRTTTLRYSNVYGPRQNAEGEAGVVAIFTNRLLRGQTCTIFGSGAQTRDYVYVEDVVEANRRALEAGDGEIFNIATGVETSVLGVVEALEAAWGGPVQVEHAPPRVGEVERNCLDITKARRQLGWEPRVRVPDGIRRTIAYYRARLERENPCLS